MKNLLLNALLLLISFNTLLYSQKTMDVSLKIMYKGNPLCNWEVTLKHGDVALGKAITDDKGMAKFNGVTLLSKSVDAYGYKKTANGEKKWDVKGYIELNDAGHADFDFDPLVKEMGMPAMIENAWGLTIKDCGQVAATTSKAEEPKTVEKKEEDKTSITSTGIPSPAESNQALKANLESKLQTIDAKLEKKEKEKNKYTEGSKDHSDVLYEVEDLKLEKQLTQLQLEKTEKSIAQNNMPLKKDEREYYNQKEKEVKDAQKKLKENKKSGVLFGQEPTVEANNNEDKTGSTSEKDSKIKLNTMEELNEMTATQLKKLKVELNTQLTSKKMKLKTGGNKISADEKSKIDGEIQSIEAQIDLINQVLSTRKENE
jgi:hypothetical protein